VSRSFHVKADDSASVPAGLGQLCERYGLSDRQRDQLNAILGVLAADERAPTAVRDPVRAVDMHLADSLVALELDALPAAGAIADLGAGAGFPGLALAIALPGSSVRLVEAQARKCAFLEGLCAAAEISNARAVCVRAEEWTEGAESHEAVLARALAPPPVVVEYAAPLLRLGGALIDWRGRRDPAGERSGASAAERLGMRVAEICRVEPYGGAREHHLHIYRKVRETPDRFPRRAGVARKRPLA
jgi:16S rRNA (guanine527-N7)-methyltransferase